MALIAILTALMLERLLGTQAWWSQTALLQRYVETLREMIKLRFVWSSAIIVPLIVLPPLLAVYWLNKNIQHPVLQLSFAGLLLLLCLESVPEQGSAVLLLDRRRSSGARRDA